MQAFWWYDSNSIAGMARPGFNGTHWLSLSYEEGISYTWFARQTNFEGKTEDFINHIRAHGKKVMPLYKGIEQSHLDQLLLNLSDEQGMKNRLQTILAKTSGVQNVQINNGKISFEINQEQLQKEIDYLKSQNIKEIVALTEDHHNTEFLSKHFKLHHLPIDDLHAPELHQAQDLVGILNEAYKSKGAVAVHCMAGVGRTSTMILASQILLGKGNDGELKEQLLQRNPRIALSSSQDEFLIKVTASLQK
ncbi:MAG: dual specificity protein phosphatase family protein [Bdellovibrionaceae bacterium]|nr:dual specificity protein phosphatase family protein [Pseudobdellovibrionaceae bacterium]